MPIVCAIDVAKPTGQVAPHQKADSCDSTLDLVAEPHLVGVGKLHRPERLVGLHAQHREIGLLVATDDLGLEPRAVVQDHGDVVGIGDHVIVGDHDA